MGGRHHEWTTRHTAPVKPQERERVPAPAPWLESLAPYDPVSSLVRIWDRPSQVPLKLDWNESTIPPSPRVYQAIVSFLSHSNHLNWYPELGSRTLANHIADYVELPADNILITNGSDDALELVCKTYLGPGDRVLVPMPTYTHFLVYVQARNAEVVPYYPDDIFDADFAGLRRAIDRDTRIVYLVNPNNPTGVTYPAEELEPLLAAYPETLFIVDEAYFEFHGESVVGLVSDHANLVVTRTFSKCFGIAGLRIGYLCTAQPVLTELKKLFNPKSVNRLGQIAAMACLSDLPYYREFVREVSEAKVLFKEEMGKRGMDVVTTPANFLLLRVDNPVAFCARLADEGVYIRDRSTLPRLENYVRISVPTVAQTRDLIERIDRVLATM
jgi:histidinol-phosphate aminotransferase